ncbi:MAG: hypothetical protein ABJZ55_26025 [Fuerstiella sp.]
MRNITGAILILTAEQAFAHAYLIEFPNAALAQDVLVPASYVLAVLGVGFLIWGAFPERKHNE